MAEMSGTKTAELISVEPLVDHIVVKDRISELPWEILDNILGRLPIKNAVATTILSRKWKDKWVDVSKIVLDDYSNEADIMDSRLFSKLVYHVLLSHRGTIEKFTLVSHGSESFHSDIDHWISFLSRCHIKELTLYLSSTRAQISELISSCEQFRHLCLTNCFISMPGNVPLFRTLVSLHLTRCFCFDPTLEEIINNSPNLEKLVLENTGFKRLTICAPSLRYLSLEGEFNGIYLETCPLLTDASFKMTAKVEEISDDLIQPPHWLSRIRRLVMSGFFLKFLAKRYNWDGASIDCHNLEVLELDTLHFDDSDEKATAFSILVSSSTLKILLINGLERPRYELGSSVQGPKSKRAPILDWHSFAEAHKCCCFNKLHLVRITILGKYVSNSNRDPSVIVTMGSDAQAQAQVESFPEIIRILLLNSPVLENMHIHYSYLERDDIWFMRKLLSCERASSQLKLTYTSTPSVKVDIPRRLLGSFRL